MHPPYQRHTLSTTRSPAPPPPHDDASSPKNRRSPLKTSSKSSNPHAPSAPNTPNGSPPAGSTAPSTRSTCASSPVRWSSCSEPTVPVKPRPSPAPRAYSNPPAVPCACSEKTRCRRTRSCAPRSALCSRTAACPTPCTPSRCSSIFRPCTPTRTRSKSLQNASALMPSTAPRFVASRVARSSASPSPPPSSAARTCSSSTSPQRVWIRNPATSSSTSFVNSVNSAPQSCSPRT